MKLLLNLCLIASGAVPRGGVVAVDISGDDHALTMRVEAKAQTLNYPIMRPTS